MKSSQLKHGDILINITGASIGRTCLVPASLRQANINQHIAFLRIRKSFNPLYIAWFLKSCFIKDYIQIEQNGASKEAFNLSQIANIPLALQPIDRQATIAHYLDTKTAQIDRKIDLLTQKAQRYEELKRSLINETVTRGLDKSVPMKDSGIEWIGEIPEHWEVERINDVAVQQKIKNVGLKEKNLLSLSYGKIKRRDFDTSFGLLPESFETYQIIEADNIILRLTDLQNDQRSLRVGLVPEKGIITSAYLCLKFAKRIYPNFAYYLLHSYDLSKVFYWFGGGLRQSMKFDDIRVFPFAFPQYSEQKAISDYLDAKTSQIDQIIQTIKSSIGKQKELRKTLINDVVTGKIKVA
jgi:type I restriction enzyme S subunit